MPAYSSHNGYSLSVTIRSYDELVCTAGIWKMVNGCVFTPFLGIYEGMKIKGNFRKFKYTWIELDLKEET